MDDLGVPSSRRARRLAAVVRQAISEELGRMSDPALQDVVVTGVDVGVDLDLATVYFFVRGGADALRTAQEALDRSQGRLRKSVARWLHTKRVPKLRFRVDEGIVRGMSVEDKLAEIATMGANSPEDEPDISESPLLSEARAKARQGTKTKRDHSE